MSTPEDRRPDAPRPDVAPTLAGAGATWSDEPDDGPASVEDAVADEVRYELVRVVGRGGIGKVVASRDRRLRRVVARKELVGEPGSDGATARQEGRFLREARLTARLEHPGIVPVYDVGRGADGTPYYTMRLIVGRSLADALRDAEGLAGRLKLLGHFVDLCQAVAYAHGQGVVHRDVKPANVMLGDYGETLLVDWGIAKEVDAGEEAPAPSRGRGGAETVPGGTGHGAVLGTPAYMSPEQARGDHASLDGRSDVWSLGAILYEVLTGRPPHVGLRSAEVLAKARVGEVDRVVAVEPRAPLELVAVAEKALASDPADRYRSALELAREVEAFLTGDRVAAYGYSSWELLRRFVMRHRAAVAVAGVATVLLLAVASASYLEVVEQRDRAVALGDEAKAALAEAYVEKATSAADDGRWIDAELYAAAALANVEDPDARGVLARTGYVWKPELAATYPLPGGCLDVEVSPRGDAVACGGPDGARVVDLGTGAVTALFGERTHAVSWGPRGDLIALAGRPRTVAVHRRDGELVRAWETQDNARTVAMSPDGAEIAFGDGGALYVAPVEGGAPVRVADVGGQITGLDFSPDGDLLAVGAQPGGAQVWARTEDGWTRRAAYGPHFSSATSVVFSPDGGSVLFGCHGNDAHVWDHVHDVERVRLEGHVAPVLSVAWGADGRLVTGSEDLTAAVWVDTGRRLSTIPAHEGWYAAVDLAPDGSVVAGGREPELRVWRGPGDGRHQTHHADDALTAVAVAPGGAWIAGGTGSGQVSVWVPGRGASLRTQVGGAVRGLAVAPDGDLLVASSDRALRRLSSEDGAVVWEQALGREVSDIEVAGARVLVAGPRGEVGVRDLATGAGAGSLEGTDGILQLAVSADGRLAAGLSRDTTVVVLDLETGAQVGAVEVNPPARTIALSPDGTRLAIGHRREFTVGVWDWATSTRLALLEGHQHQISGMAFSPDGAWLATGSWDRTVRMWRVDDGVEQVVLRGHRHHVADVAFSPRGDALVSGAWDATVRVWTLGAAETDGTALLDEIRRRYGVALVGGHVAGVRGAGSEDGDGAVDAVP